MELISDVKQGLNMINYLNAHPTEFTNCTIPFMISVMQSLGGLFAEATNLFMIATRESVADCITFFVAFHVLTAIDNIYQESLSDFELREALELRIFYAYLFTGVCFLTISFFVKINNSTNDRLTKFEKSCADYLEKYE